MSTSATIEPAVAMHPTPAVGRDYRFSVRVRQSLGMVLVGVLGAALLGWYYARAGAHQRSTVPPAAASANELILPPLPSVDLPTQPQPDPGASTLGLDVTTANSAMVVAAGTPPRPAHGRTFVETTVSPPIDTATTSPVLLRPVPPQPARASGDVSATGIAGLLNASPNASVAATRLADRTFLLPKGSAVGCTLETAIDSQLPGLVTCVTGVDVFGADGRAVLLERGTKLFGEAKSDAHMGQARVFILWTEARTPAGIVVPVASPATDAQGRSGATGEVDTHFFARFGAAMLISVLDAGVQAMARRGGATVVYAPQGTEAVLSEILRNTIAIPPTIRVPPGTRLEVLVARDVDFRAVYPAVAPP